MIATTELKTIAMHMSVASPLVNPVPLNAAKLTRTIIRAPNRKSTRKDTSPGRYWGCATIQGSDRERLVSQLKFSQQSGMQPASSLRATVGTLGLSDDAVTR